MSKLQKKVYLTPKAAWYLAQMQTVTGKTQSAIIEDLVLEADQKRSAQLSPEVADYLTQLQRVTGKTAEQTIDDLVFAEAENRNLIQPQEE